MRFTKIHLFLMSLPLSTISCVPLTPHENFKEHMEFNVGKQVDDPSSYVARYPDKVGADYKLANGNYEVEYIRNEGCRVYFEVDSETAVIVNWRYEGNQSDCVITP